MSEDTLALNDLTDDELQLLIGLLMVAVNADNHYSAIEATELKRIAETAGRDRFLAAANQLRDRYPDQKSILDAASTVERPAARKLIYDLVAEVSEADGLVTAEVNLLAWLTKRWNLGRRG